MLSGPAATRRRTRPSADDHGDGWDTEWLDTRIDEFLSSDDVDPPHLEIQLMLWDRGSGIWPEPVDPQFPHVVQPTLFDGGSDDSALRTATVDVTSSTATSAANARSREFGRVQVA